MTDIKDTIAKLVKEFVKEDICYPLDSNGLSDLTDQDDNVQLKFVDMGKFSCMIRVIRKDTYPRNITVRVSEVIAP